MTSLAQQQQQIGGYRNGVWYLDTNGDNAWSGVADHSFQRGAPGDRERDFGDPGDVPVVGRWTWQCP